MLRPRRLVLAFELGHIRRKGGVRSLEDLEAFLGRIELGPQIDVLLLQNGHPVLPLVRQPALLVVGNLEIVDSLPESSCGSGISLFRASPVPEFPKGRVRGISWVRALPL